MDFDWLAVLLVLYQIFHLTEEVFLLVDLVSHSIDRSVNSKITYPVESAVISIGYVLDQSIRISIWVRSQQLCC